MRREDGVLPDWDPTNCNLWLSLKGLHPRGEGRRRPLTICQMSGCVYAKTAIKWDKRTGIAAALRRPIRAAASRCLQQPRRTIMISPDMMARREATGLEATNELPALDVAADEPKIAEREATATPVS